MNIKKNLLSAQAFYINNDLESAKKICESLLRDDKNNFSVIELLIDINIKSENYIEALKFLEKIIFLPTTYQPNDNKKEISKKDFDLPDDKFIFCSFNRSYKITSKILDIWTDVLNYKKNSILWLFADNNLTKTNLKSEFANLGINADRIIFANPTDHPEHLARHKFADLFIDTFPYTGHTTVSDALWTGLPVVTKIGNSFASRVSASLLKALDLSELIAKTDEEYKKMILELSSDQTKLLKIKEKISKNIFKKALFDSKLYTENLEKAYNAIYENYSKNKKNDIQI